MNRDHFPCDCCGRVEHIDLLDAKPDDPANPEGCDWNRFECIACYGPGWSPANGWYPGERSPDPFVLSICDELHGLYLGWRIMERLRDWRSRFQLWRMRRRWARRVAKDIARLPLTIIRRN